MKNVTGNTPSMFVCNALLLVAMLTSAAQAATCVEGTGFAWDNATPAAGQSIDATDILIDGAAVDQVAGSSYSCDSLLLNDGQYTITVRHVGTIDGQPAVSAESNAVTFNVLDAGPPGVGPLISFRRSFATGAA